MKNVTNNKNTNNLNVKEPNLNSNVNPNQNLKQQETSNQQANKQNLQQATTKKDNSNTTNTNTTTNTSNNNPKDKNSKQIPANLNTKNQQNIPPQNTNSKIQNQIQNQNKIAGNPSGRKTPNTLLKPNAKGQIIPEEVEIQPPPPKEKNLERFIHITNYKDHESIRILKELFETINKQAFDLKSTKETYTRDLTNVEKEDNNLDYISGFQLIDTNTRITIIEGISDKAMKMVKEKLPKNSLNTNTKKIFSNSKFLYDTRLYNEFNLCLKLI